MITNRGNVRIDVPIREDKTMSAFVVSESHIDVLVHYAAISRNKYWFNGEWKGMENETELGIILLKENVDSVNERYSEDEPTPDYSFVVPSRMYTPVEIIKACDCLRYQSCETDDYERTEAYAILDSIREAAIHALPKRDEAQWEICDNTTRRDMNNRKADRLIAKQASRSTRKDA